MIIGVDWGGAYTKLCTPQQIESFPSNIVPYSEIHVENELRKYDYIFEYEGRRGLAGTLAQDESTALDSNRRGDTKFHEDALIRLLIAIHQFVPSERVKVVVGQPITRHKKEKEQIRDMLVGPHTITVNNMRKTIFIQDAAVGAEGASAFYSNIKRGAVHLIDVGSGTINFATIKDKRFINSQSGTISRGLENLDYDLEDIAAAIRNKTIDLEWSNNIYLLGGGAELLRDYLPYQLFYPTYYNRPYAPEFANAIGFFRVGEMLWGRN